MEPTSLPIDDDLPPDDELLGRTYRIEDPTTLDGFLDRVRPLAEDMPALEYVYYNGSAGTRLPCAYCRDLDKPNHLKGFVLKYPDGARVLIGNLCGEEHFGQREFKRMRQRFEAEANRQSLLRRRGAALGGFPALLAGLRATLASDGVDTYRRLQATFRHQFPRLAAMLNYAVAARGGEVFYYAEVRNLKAESDREERREEEAKRQNRPYVPDRTPIMKQEERRLGVVRFGDFFRDVDGAPQQMERLYGQLEQSLALLPSLSSTADLNSYFRGLRDTLTELDKAIDRVDRLGLSLSTDNLALFADLCTRLGHEGSYQAGPLVLEHRLPDSEVNRMEVPANLPRIDRSFLGVFRHELEV